MSRDLEMKNPFELEIILNFNITPETEERVTTHRSTFYALTKYRLP